MKIKVRKASIASGKEISVLLFLQYAISWNRGKMLGLLVYKHGVESESSPFSILCQSLSPYRGHPSTSIAVMKLASYISTRGWAHTMHVQVDFNNAASPIDMIEVGHTHHVCNLIVIKLHLPLV